MESVTIIVEGLRAVLVFLNLFFITGLAISLAFFPRFTDMGLMKRLAWSVVLSIGTVIASVLFMDFVLGVNASLQNISLGLCLFSLILLVVWFFEVWYLISSLPEKLHHAFSGRFLTLRRYFSRLMNSREDRFARTAMTRVIWHDSARAGTSHIDHTYLIDVKEAIDIQQIDETKWKVSEPSLMPPPYPRTWYFELVIREFNDGNISLIDDLQLYPVMVTRKPDLTLLGYRIRRGALKIRERIYKKTETSEIQWIYSHDFHLFAILYSEDTLGQMVDRVLLKLDEIATSIKKGSRVSSHLEETQNLKAEFEGVLEKPRTVPTPSIREEPAKYGTNKAYAKPISSPPEETRTLKAEFEGVLEKPRRAATPSIKEEPVKYGTYKAYSKPIDSDRRELQADIVRNLKVSHITPETFRRSDRMILDIKIPQKIGVDMILDSIRDLQDDDWLYE